MATLLTRTPPGAPPTPQEIAAARAALQKLAGADLNERLSDAATLATLTLPDSVVRVLAQSLTEVANGNSVTLIVSEAELTSNQAAEFLGISRSYLVKLLDDGNIPFRTVGTHRRIRVRDLQLYRDNETARRTAVMQKLIAETQRLGLYE